MSERANERSGAREAETSSAERSKRVSGASGASEWPSLLARRFHTWSFHPLCSGKLIQSSVVQFKAEDLVSVNGSYVSAYCEDKKKKKVFPTAYLTLVWQNDTAKTAKDEIWKAREQKKEKAKGMIQLQIMTWI